MNEEALRRTLETGRTWFWSRSRQEYWCKGETSGDRQYVREAYYDCDMDVLLFVVEQEGRGACHTGERSCFFRAFGGGADARARVTAMRRRVRPSLDEFVALARDHTVVPVWREVLADLETPVSAFVKLVGDGEGFLLESVEHAERWGRFSFLGRDPALTLVVRGRDGRVSTATPPPGVPDRPGRARRARSAAARATGRRGIAELPPFHGGIVG